MESFRDVKRVMERERRKGSCPLAFLRLEFPERPFQLIESSDQLDGVLSWLLRTGRFEPYAQKTILNNVYMDVDILCRRPRFVRARSGMERREIYARIQRYKNRLSPDYEGGICLETVRCVFGLPGKEAEKYRITYEGKETYGFAMSNKYILGLFAFCEAARKEAALDKRNHGQFSEKERKIAWLDGVEEVFFQALLLDDVEYGGGELTANLHTIYCLKKG